MSALRPFAIAALGFSIASGVAFATPLEATALYREKASGCRTLDLATWSHPTRKVMETSRVKIHKVELCNGDVYPIFTVGLPGEPLVRINDAYYNELNARMAQANGWHSYAFVDAERGVIIYVDVTGKRQLSLDYEEFDAASAK